MDKSFFESKEFKEMCKLYYDDKEHDMDKWSKIRCKIQNRYTCRDYCYKWMTYDVLPYADISYSLKWPSELDQKNFENADGGSTKRKAIVIKGRVIDVEVGQDGRYKLTLIGLDEKVSKSNFSQDIMNHREAIRIRHRIVAYQLVQERMHTIGDLKNIKPGATVMVALLHLEVCDSDERCILACFTDIMQDYYLDNIYLDKQLLFKGESDLIVEYVKYLGADNARPKVDNEEKQGCYIATAVYSSYDCPQVWTLRRFRDEVLRQKRWGRAFVKQYYRISPLLVEKYGEKKWFNCFWKCILDRMVEILQICGIKSTKYQDR